MKVILIRRIIYLLTKFKCNMAIIKILEESNNLPIPLEDIKLFLKVDYDDEDALILRTFKTAIKQCELNIGRSVLKKKYQYSFYNTIENNVKLLYGPVLNIENIKIITNNNEEILINIDNYKLDIVSDKIIFKNKPNNFYRIDIIYNAHEENLAEDIKQGILFHTAKIFEDKLGYSPIPRASYNIYKQYKSKRL